MVRHFLPDQSQVHFLNESGTYASAVGSAKWVGMVQSHEADENVGVIQARYLGTGTRNVDQFIDGPKSFNGTFTYFPQEWTFAYFALGKVTDGGSPSPFLHTVTEANGDNSDPTNKEVMPSFQLVDHQGIAVAGSNLNRTFKGCMVNSMSVSVPQGEPVSVEVSYVAQDVSIGSAAKASVTARTDRPFLYEDVNVHLPSGTTLGNVKEFNLNINNNLIVNHFVDGGRTIGVPQPGDREYQVELTLNALNGGNTLTPYMTRFISGTEFNMLIDMTASTGSRDCLITCSGCKLLDMSAPTSLGDVHEQTLTIAPSSVSILSTDDIQYWRAFSGA